MLSERRGLARTLRRKSPRIGIESPTIQGQRFDQFENQLFDFRQLLKTHDIAECDVDEGIFKLSHSEGFHSGDVLVISLELVHAAFRSIDELSGMVKKLQSISDATMSGINRLVWGDLSVSLVELAVEKLWKGHFEQLLVFPEEFVKKS